MSKKPKEIIVRQAPDSFLALIIAGAMEQAGAKVISITTDPFPDGGLLIFARFNPRKITPDLINQTVNHELEEVSPAS